jgi:GH24 family phage-related lysozyme (muramidase)
MYPSVAAKWLSFNKPLEGMVRFMYQDVKGLITIGMGNLIDPIDVALDLPFKRRAKPGVANPSASASRAEIEAEWRLIKNTPGLAKKGHKACDPLCALELADDAIDRLIRSKLADNEAFLRRQQPFAKFDSWPADAQMGLLSMAWAMGPGFAKGWPKFSQGCAALDFEEAAKNCRMSEKGNAGVIPRNNANQRLFRNAAAVLAGQEDGFYTRSRLYYPTVLLKPIVVEG